VSADKRAAKRAGTRSARDERRRSLGQNFLRPDVARALVAEGDFVAGGLVVEIGAGLGACTFALARHGVRVIALEKDPRWAERLRHEVRRRSVADVSVLCGDALEYPLPHQPFRVLGSLPFGATTAILRHLLDDPGSGLERADLVVQWEVARKRVAAPPSTLLSATWAPWWTFAMGRRIPAGAFRPVPAVDAAVLRVTRRRPPILPDRLAAAYGRFVRDHWS
jgi:23S rRNA (adenine-N6)-dimethyltransferase